MRPMRDYVVPRALDLNEIPGIVAEFRRGAENAKRAGFDGVEIHGANGYLLDQFFQDSTNLRTDAYGGPLENRARLMLEVVDACIAVWGADRVGLHLAPRCDTHTMGDSNPLATFGYVAEQAGRRKIAFLCTREHPAADCHQPAAQKSFWRRADRQREIHQGNSRGNPRSWSGRCRRLWPALHRQSGFAGDVSTSMRRSTHQIHPRSTRKGPRATPIIQRSLARSWGLDRRQRPAARRLATRSKASANSREPAIVIASPMRRSSSACSSEPVSPITILFT